MTSWLDARVLVSSCLWPRVRRKMERKDERKEVSGYVHNLSPIENGRKKKYFDFNLQTGKYIVVRSICFSPLKRKRIEEPFEMSSPIKITRFVNDKKKEGSTNILMGDDVVIGHLKREDLLFERDLVPPDFNLSMLPMITPNQLVTLRGKVVNLQKSENVNMDGRRLQKVLGMLVDPFGYIKIVAVIAIK